MAHDVTIKPDPQPDDKHQRVKFYAAIDHGQAFLVGRGVKYEGRFGLERDGPDETCNFAQGDFAAIYGTWAQLLDATALCESGRSLVCLNTYDRARMTFGAFQFAAHVANGDFVRWLRLALALPGAGDYFPELVLADGHVALAGRDGERTRLEDSKKTTGLMDYFKPDPGFVTRPEIERAARLIAWTRGQVELQRSQVEVAHDTFRSYARNLAVSLPLDGLPDYLVCVVLDVWHQRRGHIPELGAALRADTDPAKTLAALLGIGAAAYASRCAVLGEAIRAKVRDGLLGNAAYSAKANEFVSARPGKPSARHVLTAANMPMPPLAPVPAASGPVRPDPEVDNTSDIDTRVAAFCTEISAEATALLKKAAAQEGKGNASKPPASPKIAFAAGKAADAGFRTPEQQALEVANGASQVCWSAHMTGKARDLIMTVDGKVRWDPATVFGKSFDDFKKAWGDAMGRHGLKNYRAGDGWSAGDEFHLELPDARIAKTDDRAKSCLTEYVRLTRSGGMHPNAKFEKTYAALLKPYIAAYDKANPRSG